MKSIKKKYLYVWACDFSKSRGEGLLARNFIKDCSRFTNKKIYINGKSYSDLKKKNIQIKTNIFNNYFYPFLGVLKIWREHLSRQQTIYLNYLPLWNCLLFLFLPRKTILGPITGGSFYSDTKSFNYYIRKYLFPVLFFLILKIIKKKFDKVIFSTDLLKKYKNKNKKFIFNYCLNIYDKKIYKNDKKYDVIFYYRINKNKNNLLQKKLIKKLIKNNYKIIIIGDNPNLKNAIYLGNLDREKVLFYISKSKLAVNNNENIYSLFCIDSLSCGTKVIFFGKKINQYNYFNTGSILCRKINNVDRQFLLLKKLLRAKNNKKISVNKNFFKNKNKINKHFLNLHL